MHSKNKLELDFVKGEVGGWVVDSDINVGQACLFVFRVDFEY